MNSVLVEPMGCVPSALGRRVGSLVDSWQLLLNCRNGNGFTSCSVLTDLCNSCQLVGSLLALQDALIGFMSPAPPSLPPHSVFKQDKCRAFRISLSNLRQDQVRLPIVLQGLLVAFA